MPKKCRLLLIGQLAIYGLLFFGRFQLARHYRQYDYPHFGHFKTSTLLANHGSLKNLVN
jgi:hypothetical protein